MTANQITLLIVSLVAAVAITIWLKRRTFPAIKFSPAIEPDFAGFLKRHQWVVEVLLIAAVAVYYVLPILDFDPRRTMPGGEYQAHAGSMILFTQWLRGGQDFPLWNPVVGYGRSLIADPFLFIFNPFLSLPMILLGVVNGTKLAVLMNFLLAGLGMWTVGRMLKFETITRLWVGLLYILSGSLVSHLTIGQEQLAFALGWLPWSLAGFMWALKTRSWASVAGAGAAQALFFFSGNFYYQLYGATCLLVIAIFYAIEWAPVRLNGSVIWQAILVGVISLGLVAIQFLPQLASRSSIRNSGGFAPEEEEFYGSQTAVNALLNYVISDREFVTSPVLAKAPHLQESYRYIGLAPFVLLLWLAPAVQRGNRREIAAFAICFLLMLAWTSIRYSFFKEVYRAIPLLFQFRWPGRAMNVGAFYLILLSGYGLNELWLGLRSLQGRLTLNGEGNSPIVTLQWRTPLLALVVVGAALSVQNVYAAHHDLLYLTPLTSLEADAGLAWLRARDSTEYAMHTTSAITKLRTFAAYDSHLRFVRITDGWKPTPANVRLGRPEAITLQPKYWLIWEVETVDVPQAELLKQFGTLQIWQAPGFPYAFLVPIERLTREPFVIDPGEVTPAASARRDGPNRIVIEVTADVASALVVSESWFADWKVWVDERETPLDSVSSLLAVQLPPGKHHVVFQYDPPSLKFGAGITALTLLLIAGLVFRERKKQTTAMMN